MTLFEAILVLFIIALLAVILLPPLISQHPHNHRVNCVNNLKQVGLAFLIWSGDNGNKYPMGVSVTSGGTMELMNTPDAWKVFQVMSNELSTPKILFCPEDSLRGSAATNWTDELKTKISYFAGLDATETNSFAFLAGDGNFILDDVPANHDLVNVTANASLKWDTTRHRDKTVQGWFNKSKTAWGNIVLGDCSVQSLSQVGLKNAIAQTGFVTNRLAIP